ncbi:hypothetical protein DB346_21860 [Verrucomicrobia bacterium LW23]|nr:hypothetical protein DB346_21860 [Verrucomicrobia bacterium LW23]
MSGNLSHAMDITVTRLSIDVSITHTQFCAAKASIILGGEGIIEYLTTKGGGRGEFLTTEHTKHTEITEGGRDD